MADLAIKLNNAATNDPCAICGARTEPVVGPELFMADSWALVCRACGKRHAPELAYLLNHWDGIRETTELDDAASAAGGVM